MTPTARTLTELRHQGYTAAPVEEWNPWARADRYGFIDILAIKEGERGVLAVRTSSTDHVANRMKKAEASPNLRVWLKCGNRFEVWGWAKRGVRGERKTWTLEVVAKRK